MANLDTEGQRFVDRNDPAASDWAVGDFTTDGNWHDLDLSGVLPPEAAGKLVLFRCRVKDGATDSFFQLRRKGLSNAFNLGSLQTQNPNTFMDGDLVVCCDSSRLVEYRTTNTAFTELLVTISGWWVST